MKGTALDQYEEIVTDALKSYSAKLRKSFKNPNGPLLGQFGTTLPAVV